mmetsp:Transcript_31508/g.59144  ORF Transcript_31508/g.59144 Transcript_31508/m.59144 type:complete len:89 (-) Transcript_31508:526-792(-)
MAKCCTGGALPNIGEVYWPSPCKAENPCTLVIGGKHINKSPHGYGENTRLRTISDPNVTCAITSREPHLMTKYGAIGLCAKVHEEIMV